MKICYAVILTSFLVLSGGDAVAGWSYFAVVADHPGPNDSYIARAPGPFGQTTNPAAILGTPSSVGISLTGLGSEVFVPGDRGGFGVAVSGKRFAWGLSGAFLTVRDIEVRRDEFTTSGTISEFEGSLRLTIAARVRPGMSVGVGLVGIRGELGGLKGNGYAIDTGMIQYSLRQLRIGIVLRNVFSSLRWGNGYTDRFAKDVGVGIAYSANAALSPTFLLDIRKRRDNPISFRPAVELTPSETLVIGGSCQFFRDRPESRLTTFAASFALPKALKLRYSMSFTDIGDDHRVGMEWQW